MLRNERHPRAHALELRLRAAGRNREAIGARVVVNTGSTRQRRDVTAGSSYLSQNDLRVHVGLGGAPQADRVEIRWPSGRTETLTGVAADQIVTVDEGRGIADRIPFRP